LLADDFGFEAGPEGRTMSDLAGKLAGVLCVIAVPLLGACSGIARGFGFTGTDSGASDGAAEDDSPPPSAPPVPDPGPNPAPGPGTGGGLDAIDCGTDGVAGLVTADTAFAVAFLSPAVASAGDGGTNVIVSPYGVSSAMMMVDVGAAGETDSQIESVLSLPASGAVEAPAYTGLACALQADGSSNGNSLDVANALWGQAGVPFEPTFLGVLAQGYGAPLQTADFASDPSAATATIDDWVSRVTQGNIPSLLGPADVTIKTLLVLVNAVYFKGAWATGFDPGMTGPRPFTLSDGSQTTASTMTGTIQASAAASSSLVVLQLPYKGNALAMDILMPAARGRDAGTGGLAAFESALTPTALNAALSSLQGPAWDIVYLPKFSFTTRVELASVLEGLGMTDAFRIGVANLSGMDGAMDLSVAAVVQEARIEVDEVGTVAAAGTGVTGCGDCSAIEEPPSIVIDHPFLFLIRDTRNGAIVFMGQVVNPGQ
jgi:serpin B